MLIFDPASFERKIGYFLPHELIWAQRRAEMLGDYHLKLVADKVDAMAGTTENMGHDEGALEVGVGESGILHNRASPTVNAIAWGIVLDYPPSDEPRVTVGSRVKLQGKRGQPYWVDVAGAANVSDLPRPNADVDPARYDAPLAQKLIGQVAGKTVSYQVERGRPAVTVTILEVDQVSQRLEAEAYEATLAESAESA